jgi:hypothetical protein
MIFDRENFIELCIEEVYDLIIDKHHWPNSFTNDMKLELLTRIRKYYEKKDTVSDYEKCAKLQSLIDVYVFEVSGSLKEEVI